MECGKEIFYREFSTRSDEKYFEKIFFFELFSEFFPISNLSETKSIFKKLIFKIINSSSMTHRHQRFIYFFFTSFLRKNWKNSI